MYDTVSLLHAIGINLSEIHNFNVFKLIEKLIDKELEVNHG